MPLGDIWIVLRWWGTLFLVGAAAYPFTSSVFSRWFDRGYMFSKATGMALITWCVFVLGVTKLVPFTSLTIVAAVSIIFASGVWLTRFIDRSRTHIHLSPQRWKRDMALIALEELFFLALLFLWSWVKAHEPSIRGLEKFMDYGFMNSILHARYFPPDDMWYPPLAVNYYYFGHMVTAMLTKLSGLDLAMTFNLMLATIFALCFTMSYSIGYQLSLFRHSREGGNLAIKKDGSLIGLASLSRSGSGMTQHVFSGILTAFLVTLAGNMQTIYAFTKGYSGDNVAPFWKLFWPMADMATHLTEGMDRYWYANATRFIPYTIHEFPSYSFVVSDVHGHVLSIPFVLLTVAMLFLFFGVVSHESGVSTRRMWGSYIFYGFLSGVLLMTNALDGPIYLGLFCALLLILPAKHMLGYAFWNDWGKKAGVVILAALVSSLPFLIHFKSFVNGIAVDCPPARMANTKVGPLLFEAVEKCQKSPFWMMYLLWGFFWFCGVWFIVSRFKNRQSLRDFYATWRDKFTQVEKVLVVMFLFSVLLIIFPEFFYFKDIYPMHFRSNTMFKLGYQAFIMYSIMSAYTIVYAIRTVRKSFSGRIFLFLLLPQLFLVSIYPYFSVRSYFGQLRSYESIWGLGWLAREYPDNFAAISWLNMQPQGAYAKNIDETIVEADGDSYTDYNQFSVFAGKPTIIGWAVHEWLWRGSYDVVAPRRGDVRTIYESTDVNVTKMLLNQYHVRYIVVGTLERNKFTKLQEQKIAALASPVYRMGNAIIYKR